LDWKRIFDAVGLNGTRWQWKIMRWERNLKGLMRGQVSMSGISITRILIFVNLILFTLMTVHGLLAGIGLRALFNPPTQLLLAWGGQFWPAVLQYGQWWRCLTYAFTHGGIIHLGFNMVVLFQVGPLIESELQPARFIILYTFTALTATLLGYLWHPMTPVVGASGSLFGLIGFAVVYFHRLGTAGQQIRNFMFQWAIFAFVFGLMVGADNAGHLGGAIGGAALGLVFPPYRVRQHPFNRHLINALALLCTIAVVAAIATQLWWVVTARG